MPNPTYFDLQVVEEPFEVKALLGREGFGDPRISLGFK
jgi:hypothetical protein